MNLTWMKRITRKKAVRVATAAIIGVILSLIIRKQISNWKVPISVNLADHAISAKVKAVFYTRNSRNLHPAASVAIRMFIMGSLRKWVERIV